ncbi:hypothetical protein Dsin_026266 [Dipteronia sinensis]|uniref:RNase H type-1 domain-containing protein n=1 Tax=Dipteronia sinensis TaxID=43782 RepID=A0AAE0DXY3_9ROSI|nr:hypothetical protein Dsin_026266 [Dipteronia sinensis]
MEEISISYAYKADCSVSSGEAEIDNLLHRQRILAMIHCAAVAFVPGSANQVAHGLAKYALSCNEDRYWLEEVPICVSKLVLAECRSSL